MKLKEHWTGHSLNSSVFSSLLLCFLFLFLWEQEIALNMYLILSRGYLYNRGTSACLSLMTIFSPRRDSKGYEGAKRTNDRKRGLLLESSSSSSFKDG